MTHNPDLVTIPAGSRLGQHGSGAALLRSGSLSSRRVIHHERDRDGWVSCLYAEAGRLTLQFRPVIPRLTWYHLSSRLFFAIFTFLSLKMGYDGY